MRHRSRIAIIMLSMAALPARAATVAFSFESTFQTGPLAGTSFPGTGSYDNSMKTGVGTDYLQLTALDFTLLGFPFTKAQIGQGGQAILQDGVLQYFTAAFFIDIPLQDIAFGFGGPGVIGYIVAPQQFGEGSYTVSAGAIPEPSSAVLLVTGSLALAAVHRRATARRRRYGAAARSGDLVIT